MNLEVAFESAITYSREVFEAYGMSWKKFMNYADFLPNGREYIRNVCRALDTRKSSNLLC